MKNCPAVFQSGYILLHSPQQYMNGLFLFLKYVLFLYLTLLGL